ncbi:response regulator [Aureibaculum algae]|uniref:histidine kinase n=1 Tax=Aureibaculum algae TaxID=2584122 RepID=A0A5B7TSM5_9FLAO|nr:two-component regulator propeller domain-containing protein [Aureibaculum algae]QCX37957.1 response regulator [Aureibaculum algae]
MLFIRKKYSYHLLIILFFFTFYNSFSQHYHQRIKHYSLEDGLSQTTILDLLKDSSGFIWIGTQGGLNRFDGQQFRHFKPISEDTTSISNTYINKLLEDKNGNIWIGTLNGLNIYNPQSDVFNKVSLSTFKNEIITSLEVQENGTIWVGTRKTGVHRLLPLGQNKFQKENFLSTTSITSLFIDSQKQLWIGGFEGAVFILDLNNSEIELKPLHLNIQGRVQTFYRTEKKLLIGTEVGFYIYDLITKNVKRVNLNEQHQGLTKQVTEFLDAGNFGVWVGTDSGVFLFDWKNEKVLNKIEYRENDIKGLSNDRVYSLLQLNESQLFVGTNSNLDLIDFNIPYFKNISKNKKGAHILNDNSISAIFKDEEYTWVGTSVGGLNLITRDKTYYFKEDQTKPYGITGNEVREILKDTKNQRLWIATTRGLNMIDLKTFDPDLPIFKTFTYDPKNSNSISNDFLKGITLDTEYNVWGATYGHGIFRLQLSNDNTVSIIRFKNNKSDPNSLANDFVEKIFSDPKNTIWAGTQGGLSRLSFTDNSLTKPSFINTTVLESSRNSNATSIVLDITIDSKGNKWLASSTHGLNLYLGNNKFKTWTDKEMNLDGIIYSLQHDDNDNLWMGTTAGIIRFDPNTEEFKTYGIEDGIQNKDFNMHAKFKDKTGTIYFGGGGGLTYFHPKDLETIDHPQSLYFSQLRVKDEIVKTKKASKPWLTSAISKTNSLQFKNDEFPFYLNFSSIDYRLNKDVSFAYKLLPTDTEWNVLKDLEIQFLNLPAGNYTLQVNGFSRGKEWEQPPLEMSLEILPPWWSTWWSYIMYAVIAIALADRFYRFQLSRKLALAESDRLTGLDQLKSNLYTNITHEFRTPLTVILGMANTLKSNIEEKEFDTAEKSVEMITRNGNNLLRLVNELLDLAKLENEKMDLNFIKGDIIPFIKYLSESFHSMADESNIKLTVYAEIDTLVMDYDVDKLSAITYNLISNAIKFSNKSDGKIIVHINHSTVKKKEHLILKIKDNGIGISNKNIPNIFNRFYQVNASESRSGEGTGIGLALTKELVILMGGTIEVKSELHKGSEFIIDLPITRNAAIAKDQHFDAKPEPLISNVENKILSVENFDPNSEIPLCLLIEDNHDVAHYLETCLKHNYQTIHARNGIEGIELALEKIPDIIICDVMMPGKNGYEVCKTLKTDERTDHIPIIMLTAKVTLKDRLTGLSHGADAYLTKPFVKAELFTRLDQLIVLRKKMLLKIENSNFSTFMNKKAENPETKFLQKVIQFINDDIENSSFGSESLASKLNLSESQIYRKLKAITDKSTAVFIRSVRLQRAKELIQTTDKTISEIAYEVGFNNPSWFSRAFKEEFGQTPGDFK